MKKYIPYILGAVALVVLVVLVLSAPVKLPKTLDERVTLRQKDKIPYGTYAAFRLLPALFPHAQVETSDASPDTWAGDSILPRGEAVFVTSRYFDPSVNELEQISQFVQQGNYVFIITNSLSYEAADYFGVSSTEYVFYRQQEDSLRVHLLQPPFKRKKEYFYPGKKFDAFFAEVDKARTVILGSDEAEHPNFIQLRSGKGRLFVHLAPLAFSNYFLLHRNNIDYYQNALSLIPATVSKVLWNEYYLVQRKRTDEKEPGILRVLWQYPSFRWALLTAIVTLLLYMLVEMRRRQRMIPVAAKPVNDSLDFVRTLGRLYYDKGDHHNLAAKMATYFLDDVRSRFHIPTQTLDDRFIKELHGKSGYGVQELQEILFFIHRVKQGSRMSETELAHFYKQLENYYQFTGNGRTTI